MRGCANLKIVINYDLIDKIKESQSGISLKKTINKIAFNSLVVYLITLPNAHSKLVSLTSAIFVQTIYFSTVSLGYASYNREFAIKQLKILSQDLATLNISTNDELLQNSYVYKTNYNCQSNDKILPQLTQKKYIMIPCNGEYEVSLVQEHIIGSHEYFLSAGEPEKQLKLAFNGI